MWTLFMPGLSPKQEWSGPRDTLEDILIWS